MALTLKQKKNVGQVRLHWCFLLGPNDRPIGVFPNRRLPTSEELRAMAFDKLKEHGYLVKRVKPADANCIIRVYNNHYYEHNQQKYCFIGATCYTKAGKANKWVTYDSDDQEIPLDYAMHEITQILDDDKSAKIETEFFDTYVRLI